MLIEVLDLCIDCVLLFIFYCKQLFINHPFGADNYAALSHDDHYLLDVPRRNNVYSSKPFTKYEPPKVVTGILRSFCAVRVFFVV